MAESITISQLPPPFRSMQYELLRGEGLKHLQDLSGKIWTDYNEHDPGVTMLEVLSYAITDLGYRANYNIKDILTTDPNAPEDIKNFFPAKEIMPNYPVTFNDYRKLMMDVEVSTGITGCDKVGVKNAWIDISPDNEIKYYVDHVKKSLSYDIPTPPVNRQVPQVLYNVLLEFSDCETLGDLNENTMTGVLPLSVIGSPLGTNPYRIVPPLSPQPPITNDVPADMNGLHVEIEIEFPRWDTPGVDWDDLKSIQKFAKRIDLSFLKLPEKYKLASYGFYGDKCIQVSMFYNIITPLDTTGIEYELDKFIYDPVSGLIVAYQQKVKAILEILKQVKARLMANRNLGEDFFRYNAIKVEEILLCADIEVQTDANIEQVQADIFHQVERFLSPTVYFYTLSEMYAKGKTTDEIFEGPLLGHGFIDDAELQRADRRSVIHVSDLISIIMDVPGVIAVKSIQIANVPLDNDENILSHAVRWCLELAIDKNYVPRLSIGPSRLTFFKDQLPYRANEIKSQEILDALEAADRPQKQGFPSADIVLSPGEFKDIENYYSIQEEFPVVYGIGSPGLPATADTTRQAQARQLKGFLLFFDQLLADYLSQLFHVKDLFSLNEGKDSNGDPSINKTYFTQSLMNIIPDGLPLYVNELNPAKHAADLQAFAEDADTFHQRRNRFLDHLVARFAESFTDYAMLVYKLDGPKAPEELIEDKLEFLNNYPLISSARDTGFNYKSPCNLWSVDNISGLERRVEFLTGVDAQPLNELAFGKNFAIRPMVAPDQYYLEVNDGAATPYVYVVSANFASVGYHSTDEAREAMEVLIVNGAQPEKYIMYNGLSEVITNASMPGPTPYWYYISCNDTVIGVPPSRYSVFSDMLTDIQAAQTIFRDEFLNNPESNRYNFDCFMDKYVLFEAGDPEFPPVVIPCPPTYVYNYTLTNGDELTPVLFLSGKVSGLEQNLIPPQTLLEQAQNNKDRLIMDMLRDASEFANYRFGVNGSMEEIFTVVDRCGDVIGTSEEVDFNFAIQDDLNSLASLPTPVGITMSGSTGNDGAYDISGNVTMDTVISTQYLKIPVVPALASNMANGFVEYSILSSMTTLVPNISDANIADNYFTIDKDLRRRVFPGEKVKVLNPSDPDKTYTVVHVSLSGSDYLVYVKERIPSTTVNPGATMEYSKKIPVVAVDIAASPNVIYIKPGADEVAAQELADWVKAKFFSHEGMHVVEHILLRPKFKGSEYLPITGHGLKPTTTPGTLTFLRNFSSYTLDQVNKQFKISGSNYSAELPVFSKIKISGSFANDNMYTVRSAVFSAGVTIITVYESIPDATADGSLQFSATKPITLLPAFNTLKISDADATHDYSDISSEVIITGSGNIPDGNAGVNDAMYRLDPVNPPVFAAGTVTFTLLERKVPVRDDFLPIDIDNDCSICRFEEPYSYIVTVLLPAWQGRFVQQNFRRFFERTLRLECPAHLVLNICWIDCKQMGEFELAYKKWLLENAKEEKDQSELTFTLNDLLSVLLRTRSVYPEGTLHDCESEETVANSIILNNSIIGTL